MNLRRWCQMMVVGAMLAAILGVAECVAEEEPPERITMKDVEKIIRDADAKGLTQLQREETLKRCNGKLLTVSARVGNVTPIRRKEDQAEIHFTYRSAGKKPTITAHVTAAVDRASAGKLNRGDAIIIEGIVVRIHVPDVFLGYGSSNIESWITLRDARLLP